jgi:hypothetical protein
LLDSSLIGLLAEQDMASLVDRVPHLAIVCGSV